MITKDIDYPGYCAIDASGNLWVANIGGDDVTEYLKGSTKPHAMITDRLTYPVGIAHRSCKQSLRLELPTLQRPERPNTRGEIRKQQKRPVVECNGGAFAMENRQQGLRSTTRSRLATEDGHVLPLATYLTEGGPHTRFTLLRSPPHL